MSGQVLLMPDHFCIVSDHAKLKFSFDRQNVSPAADSYNLPWTYVTLICCFFPAVIAALGLFAETNTVVYSDLSEEAKSLNERARKFSLQVRIHV